MVYLGADHRGFQLKESLKSLLDQDKVAYQDLGAFSLDPADDYPMIAEKVAHAIKEKDDFVVEMTKSVFDPNFNTQGTENIQRLVHDLVGFYDSLVIKHYRQVFG